jgi:hypothetical protein
MNGNGQQQATSDGQQGQQPPAQFPISDATTMDSFEAGDWNIGFDEETGKIVINSKEKAKSPPPAQTGIIGGADPNASQSQGSQQNGQADAERIVRLEGAVTRLINLVGEMAGHPTFSNNLKQSDQQDQQTYDLGDQSGLAAFIRDSVQASVQASVKPIMDILPGIVGRIAHQDASQKYGKEFESTLPAIQELMDGGALTFDKVMNFVQKIKASSNGQSANTQGAVQTELPKQQGTPETLISKVNRVQTQTGINGSLAGGKPQISNVRDALEAAIEELSGY